MEVVPTRVLLASTIAGLAVALTPVSPILELIAAAMAMALPALLLENASALLLGSLEDKDAGMAKEPLAV